MTRPTPASRGSSDLKVSREFSGGHAGRLRETGAGTRPGRELVFQPIMGGLDPAVAWTSLELFGKQVLPRLVDLGLRPQPSESGSESMSTAARAGTNPVIAGLGITEMGKVYGRTTAEFAADAVRRAAADAGLKVADIDGLLVSTGVTGGVGLELQRDLGLRDLSMLSEMQAFGATAGAMLELASSVRQGSSDVVACVFADAPLRRTGRPPRRTGVEGWARSAGGASSPPAACRAPTPCTPWPPAGTWSGTGPRASSWARSPWPSGRGRRSTR